MAADAPSPPPTRSDALPDDAAAAPAAATGIDRHDVAIVMGSGWAPAAGRLGEPAAATAMADLPGFAAPSAAEHSSSALSIPVGDKHTLVACPDGHRTRHRLPRTTGRPDWRGSSGGSHHAAASEYGDGQP